MPDLQTLDPLKVGKTVPEMLDNDLQTEYEVRDALKEVIDLCEQKADYETRRILESLLDDTEADHIYWIEQQLKLIKMIGLENYLQKKM
jgi:bacterioferritin